MVKAKVWKVNRIFNGEPKEDDLILTEEDIPDLKDGEMLIEALYLSVDPYMRSFIATLGKVGETMFGEQISRVIQSKNSMFPVGTIVRNMSGWRSHTIITAQQSQRMPELGDLSPSTALGPLGMPGMTAYYGLLDVCKPKEGEVVVVSGAAGAVGSLVGQIAKIKGCKVIGFAGSEEKCQWLKDIGFDYAYNYKQVTIDDALTESAPNGVDCYFDNVGGPTANTVLKHMNAFGRISIIGAISQYNNSEPFIAEFPFQTVLMKPLLVQGFQSYHTIVKWPEAEKQMAVWIKEGKIRYRETIADGLVNMYTAFRQLFSGGNIGKAIVRY